MSIRQIILLGSTGSVGTQAVELVLANPDRFAIRGLSAGSNLRLLAEQAVILGASRIAVAAVPAGGRDAVREELSSAARRLGREDRVEQIDLGPDAGARLAATPADIVLNAVTGAVGLRATLAALEAGTDVALANKESLIVGGPLVLEAAARTGARLIPVDSEHSAIAQAMRAGRLDEVDRLIITASGGPFRGMDASQLEDVTPAQALVHPTWSMGTVITTNSASLVNKGLEVIEAHLLFGIDYDRIDVVVHPQSQIHSMVQFVDGSTIAQVSPPDMRLPIAYALGTQHDGRTDRIPGATVPNAWTTATQWSFEPVDHAAFPALDLACGAGRLGGTFPAVYNAANEVLVDAFHAAQVTFPQIAAGIQAALEEHPGDTAAPLVLDDVLAADAQARLRTAAWVDAYGRERAQG